MGTEPSGNPTARLDSPYSTSRARASRASAVAAGLGRFADVTLRCALRVAAATAHPVSAEWHGRMMCAAEANARALARSQSEIEYSPDGKCAFTFAVIGGISIVSFPWLTRQQSGS